MKYGRLIKTLLFGNYYYGVCAVGLAIEASLQQLYPLNGVYFYVALFTVTVWYYTKAYITEKDIVSANQRTNWYVANKTLVWRSQRIMEVISLLILGGYLYFHWRSLLSLTIEQVLWIAVFPLAAMLYYGFNLRRFKRINIRSIGWLKPFIIGFTWAGLVTVCPVLFYNIIHETREAIGLTGFLLFIKNFMFIAVLGMMFDIKDYATDANQQVKTFVVNNGLRKTIFYILIPLAIAGLGSFLLYASIRQFSNMRIVLNTIPFVLMIALAYALHRRKSIVFYLGMVDGLMIVKAICGTIAISYF